MASNLTVPRLEFEKYRLANGLEVILSEDHRLPLVAVNLWYHVGPANERPGLTGFAHLFEHMMFEGSRHVPEEGHFRLLEAAGASDINGTTDFDRTNYFETLPSNQLELALWLESDRMGFLLEKLDSAKLENQRDVVRNERRQSVEGTPYGLVQEELFHQLYPSDHPYYASVIGSHADIEAARLADIREFFRLYYAPNNASLAVVGDIDRAAAKRLVERYFGPIPAGPPVPPVDVRTPPIDRERRAVVTDDVELPRVYMAWITDPIFRPGDAECDLIARILGGGKSSRLYKRLVYDERIAQDAHASQYSLALGSLFTIESTAKPDVSPEQIEKGLDEELDRFAAEGPTEAEVERARNTIQSAVIRALETLGGFGGVADRLNQYNHYLSNPGYLGTDLARYDAATPARLRDVARTRLRRANRVVVHGIPGDKVIHDVPRSAEPDASATPPGTATLPGQEWRASIPAPMHSSALTLPVPVSFRLDNGLTVLMVEQHGLPIVSANLVVLSGSECNPPDRPGLAAFTADMLDEGTTTRPALRIAADADQLGATLSSGSSTDMSWVAVRTLKRNAGASFELLADILLHPEFPAHEIDRVRHDRITHILQQRDNPGAVASKVFFASVYGERHPYGYTEIGSEPSVRAISRDQLVRFWREGYVPERSALVVAGDITETELRQIAGELLGSWRGSGNQFAVPDAPAGGRRVVIVDKPGAPQTTLRIGHVGISRSDPDYIAVDVMNTALGGLFSSRINMNLREAHGYTYGASSGFAFRRGPGPFVVATNVRTDATAAAIAEVLIEVERMRAGEPTAEELATAKDSIARSLAGYFETTPQSASTAGQLFVHGLPLDFYRTLPERVDAVTAAEARRVAEKHLHPERLVIVAVGDRGRIQPQLEKAEFGSIEYRDPDGNPLNG